MIIPTPASLYPHHMILTIEGARSGVAYEAVVTKWVDENMFHNPPLLFSNQQPYEPPGLGRARSTDEDHGQSIG